MNFKAPVTEQRFVLDHIARIDELAILPGFDAVEPDLVDAILEGAGALAEGEWAPLNRLGDREGARWHDGEVTLPEPFKAAYRAFVDGGWGTLSAPAEYGGQGLPHVLGFAAQESLEAANIGFALGPMLTTGAIEALVHHGSEALQSAYLPKLVTGEWMGTMNLTEPQAGSDVGALRAMATPAEDGSWRVKGTKIFITFGEHDLSENIIHLVLARTPGAPPGTKGISLFLVPKIRLDGSRNDVRCLSIEHKLGIHISPTCVMAFGEDENCHGWMIGEEGGGMRAMFTMMNSARLGVGLQGVAVAERATQQALGYAAERVQSARLGAPTRDPVAIIEHPDVRRMLMRMKALTQGARALVYAAASEMDRASRGDAAARVRLDILTPLAKSYATDIGVEVASIGMQVHGGMGYIEETGAAQHYRDARIMPIYEGTNGIQAADLVGRKLTGDGGAGLHALVADILDEARDSELQALARLVDARVDWMLAAGWDDRLAASSPFLNMVSVLVAGWLMERQGRVAADLLRRGEGDSTFLRGKMASAQFYLAHIVAAASGLDASVGAGARALYDLTADELVG